ncbi:MAG: ribosome small subunit-dependent GTPase A [Bacillales bacterium]|nr:ribosome small subunit-dependent GTPase A [Bacillales bacterium]
MIDGRIISTVGGVYKVLLEDGRIFDCTPRGIFRHHKKNLLVGDFVSISIEDKQINEIKERNNSLIRPRIANLDYGIIVISLKNPDFSSYLLDKFLTLLNMSNVTPLIVLTKVDLLEERGLELTIKNNYEKIGIKTIVYSKRTLEGLEDIKETIKGKVIAFMGQTGVGKSSLINQIDPDFVRAIGEYSIGQGRGKHQTKEVIILPYENGLIADTPGFSSLELPLFKEELATYFPGFSSLGECKFNNCLHITESGCKVKEALIQNKLVKENYDNYVALSKELIFRKDRYQ